MKNKWKFFLFHLSVCPATKFDPLIQKKFLLFSPVYYSFWSVTFYSILFISILFARQIVIRSLFYIFQFNFIFFTHNTSNTTQNYCTQKWRKEIDNLKFWICKLSIELRTFSLHLAVSTTLSLFIQFSFTVVHCLFYYYCCCWNEIWFEVLFVVRFTF